MFCGSVCSRVGLVPLRYEAKVVEHLELGGFFTESVTKRQLFVSVHDAVLYCQNHRGAAAAPGYLEYPVGPPPP